MSAVTTGDAGVAQRNPFGWRFTGPLLMGSTLNPINSSMIATALVGIGVDFHRGPAQTTILISVLYLCSAVAQPTMGKLAAVFGPRRVFVCPGWSFCSRPGSSELPRRPSGVFCSPVR